MQRRYFVSEEAEKNSTQLVFDGYKAAKEAKAKHTGKLMSLGNTLTEFAKAIRNPDDYVSVLERWTPVSVVQWRDWLLPISTGKNCVRFWMGSISRETKRKQMLPCSIVWVTKWTNKFRCAFSSPDV